MLSRFFKSRRGSIAPVFAVAAIPLVAATGAVIDYTNGFRQREVVQDALDAAAVAANRLNGIESEAKVKAEAYAIFNANVAGKIDKPVAMKLTITPGTVEAKATVTVDNYFLGITGLKQQVYDLLARAVTGSGTFEVVMVLDNSGSMWGSKIKSLQQAARDLTKVLFETNQHNPKKDPIKIGVVPFSRMVNVGKTYRTSTWMDGAGKGTYHYENFDKEVNRFTLFDQLQNVTWQGCVEARPYPHDVTDSAPNPAKAATMIVPYFAPDERDDHWRYDNDYIADSGIKKASSGGGKKKKKKKKKGKQTFACGDIKKLSDQERQELTCKYEGANLTGSHQNGVSYGPNIGCTANPLQPLTKVRGKIESELAKMKASGMTNIHQGVMWGWRLLSPGAPFTEGRAYGEKDNNKIMIVMTDGANTYVEADNFNNSGYGAYGYIAKGHLGTSSDNYWKMIEGMDKRTLEACTNAKGTGIKVYTIAFKVSSSSTKKMLQNCATKPEMAYQSNSNADLIATFRRIGGEISELRLER